MSDAVRVALDVMGGDRKREKKRKKKKT